MPILARNVGADYRDPYPLSEAISDAYDEGLSNGQAWDYSSRGKPTDERDYAMARADRLEAEVERLKATVDRLLPYAGSAR